MNEINIMHVYGLCIASALLRMTDVYFLYVQQVWPVVIIIFHPYQVV